MHWEGERQWEWFNTDHLEANQVQTWYIKIKQYKLNMMAGSCNTNTQEAEAGGRPQLLFSFDYGMRYWTNKLIN